MITKPIPSPQRTPLLGHVAVQVKEVVNACTLTGVLKYTFDAWLPPLVNRIAEPEYEALLIGSIALGEPEKPFG
jgi:hypothetical protein